MWKNFRQYQLRIRGLRLQIKAIENEIYYRTKRWLVRYILFKDKENEQNISSSRALSRALRFSEKEDAKAMAVLVNGKVIEVKE